MTHRRMAIAALAAILAVSSPGGCKPGRKAVPDPAPTRTAGPVKDPAPDVARAPDVPSSGKKVLMVIPCADFRDEELLEPKKILEGKGHEVVIASTAMKGCKGMMGTTVAPGALLGEVKAADFDAIVFVGGTGSASFYEDQKALALARDAAGAGKLLGAICLAPGILGKAGVLSGRKATSYDTEQAKKAIEEGGGTWTGANVTVDGSIVTANGPDSATLFGEKIAQFLQ